MVSDCGIYSCRRRLQNLVNFPTLRRRVFFALNPLVGVFHFLGDRLDFPADKLSDCGDHAALRFSQLRQNCS